MQCRIPKNILKYNINVIVFNMWEIKIKLKQWQNIFHAIANANSMAQHVIQMKNGVIKHVNLHVKVI